MEKTFRRYLNKPSARHAFVEAEVSTAIAHQIRVIRKQRGWSQKELANLLGTTQANVSRIEDPSYGRLTFKTLVTLAKVFDTGLEVRFVSLIDQMRRTWVITEQSLGVDSFEREAESVGFVDVKPTAPPNLLYSVVHSASGQKFLDAPVKLSLTSDQATTTINFALFKRATHDIIASIAQSD